MKNFGGYAILAFFVGFHFIPEKEAKAVKLTEKYSISEQQSYFTGHCFAALQMSGKTFRMKTAEGKRLNSHSNFDMKACACLSKDVVPAGAVRADAEKAVGLFAKFVESAMGDGGGAEPDTDTLLFMAKYSPVIDACRTSDVNH